jgi:hypothetical protein
MEENTFRGYFQGIIRQKNPHIEISEEQTYSIDRLKD